MPHVGGIRSFVSAEIAGPNARAQIETVGLVYVIAAACLDCRYVCDMRCLQRRPSRPSRASMEDNLLRSMSPTRSRCGRGGGVFHRIS